MEYRPAVDIARMVSAALIVCFHSPDAPNKEIIIAGLAYFVLLTFCIQGFSDLTARSYSLRKRALRLVWPWLLWSLFYALLKVASHQPPVRDLRHYPGDLLMGTEIHLWFLPFVFVGGIAGHFLLRAAFRLSGPWALLLLSLIAASLAGVAPLVADLLTSPFAQWMYAAPLLPIGLAIGLSQHLPTSRRAYHYLAILALTLLIAWCCGEPSYVIGVSVLLIAILPKCRDLQTLKWFASLSMGIYLLHPAVFLVVYKYAPVAPWYLFASVGLIGSAVASGVIMSVPRLGSLTFGTVSRPAVRRA
jgi:Acyltransferase family